MLVAMVLGLGQTMNTFYALMRLLLIVPLLRLPRPAAYFDEKGLMDLELPLYCHGSVCNLYDYFGTMLVHVLIFVVVNFDFLKRYTSLIGAGGQVAIDEHIKKMKEKKEWRDEEPYFYFLPSQLVLECKTRSLPNMQALRDVGLLEKKNIKLIDAFNGIGIIKSILFVSHRWEEFGRPDVNGVQLQGIQEYLKFHPEIMWVWFDYSSMPQKIDGIDTRTLEEKAEFQLMLAAIADLYLTAHVLILLDGSYASRFWTLTEAWCSMQTVTSDGLNAAKDDERRYTISCIHNADVEHDAKGLVSKVATKTPEAMYGILASPDVNVTNAKDKVAILPIIQKTNERVIEGFKTFRKQASPPASEHVIDAPMLKPETVGVAVSEKVADLILKRYAIGSCVYLKRSNGEETLAYVNAYDAEEDAEEALYTVEIETLGSGQTEKCHEKDLRAAGVFEGLISSARASLFASKADDSDLHHA
jgi:hypothetical protein